jgi:hypothetical protein
MKYYGQASISDFLGDNVVYRNLVPMDGRLPALDQLRDVVGMPAGKTPRKTSHEYAAVLSRLLRTARELGARGSPIRRVIFIGDTRLNDSTAFRNICRAGNWPGLAFIGAEDSLSPKVEVEEHGAVAIMYANRWSLIDEFVDFCLQRSFLFDENTAVLLDLDKTTLGARGRNDQVINQARVLAAAQTLAQFLGERFDLESFRATYDHFNQTHFHPFTTDNQDYLVYVCLMVEYGLYTCHGLECAIDNEIITEFDSFLTHVNHRSVELPTELRKVHRDFLERVRSGDPTPFKTFRQAEYRATADRMGRLKESVPVEERLTKEIVLTQEVRKQALSWRESGALLFGLSDKPDEASIPPAELALEGYLPIHRMTMAVVGSE